jgi:hypothetical protein
MVTEESAQPGSCDCDLSFNCSARFACRAAYVRCSTTDQDKHKSCWCSHDCSVLRSDNDTRKAGYDIVVGQASTCGLRLSIRIQNLACAAKPCLVRRPAADAHCGPSRKPLSMRTDRLHPCYLPRASFCALSSISEILIHQRHSSP